MASVLNLQSNQFLLLLQLLWVDKNQHNLHISRQGQFASSTEHALWLSNQRVGISWRHHMPARRPWCHQLKIWLVKATVWLSLILCYRACRTDCEGLQANFFDPSDKLWLYCDWINSITWKYMFGSSTAQPGLWKKANRPFGIIY